MHIRVFARRRVLLASGSIFALVIGGSATSAFADSCDITRTGPGTAATVSNPRGATVTCINTQNNFTVTGSVSNAGSINANGTTAPTENGITIDNSSVSGGISNNGTITAANAGITIGTSQFVPNNATLSGGITNSGTISVSGANVDLAIPAAGIDIINVASASGTISNSGSIMGGVGGSGISLQQMNSFTGDIVNTSTGTIVTGANQSGISGGSISTFIGNISNQGTITVEGAGYGITLSVGQLTGNVQNSGQITAPGGFGMSVNATTITGNGGNSGTISVGSTGINVGGDNTGAGTFTGNVSNSGTINASLVGISIAGLTTFNGGVTNSGAVSSQDGLVVLNVASLAGNISNSGTISGSSIGIFVGAGVTLGPGNAIVNTGTIIGGVDAIDLKVATSAITIDQISGSISGAIKLSPNADVLNIFGGTIAGNIVGQGSSNTVNFNVGSGTFTYDAAYGFSGVNQVNINSGTVVLNGTNSATGVDVYGGTLAGTGNLTPGMMTIHTGGTFAPGAPGVAGTSMTINGNLAFQPGAMLLTDVSPAAASGAIVTGNASLNGMVEAVVAPGSYNSKTTYDILHAASLGGAFAGVTFVNAPGLSGTLTYQPNDVLLSLTANLGAGLSSNQQNVGNVINNVFNNCGALPPGFQNLFYLSGTNGLAQIDGEAATGAERGAFQLMTQFLGVMLDPFVDGRLGGFGTAGGSAIGFAPEQQDNLPPDIALAYASILTKAPPASTFEGRWTAWGSAYGGANNTNGNAAAGSNNVTTSTFGFAAGMDYHLSPNTIVGFSLAGAGTNWGLANALGTGRGDAMQTGVYGITHWGPAYLAGALAFANEWFTTDRSALGNQLTANFVGQSYGARLESGWRYGVLPTLGVTPYGAVQVEDFHTPAYSESATMGGAFGLAYNAMNATDVRTELGSRLDAPTVVSGIPVILRGRLAWAHDFVSNSTLNAAFQALPGGTFTVNGAPIPHDSALTTAGAELFLTPRWTLLAKFDGEFASGSQTYAGSGTLRYTW
jgi:Autotransporter beta-domain